jgi:hypothetical protein
MFTVFSTFSNEAIFCFSIFMSSSNSIANEVVVEMKNHMLTSAADLTRRP